MKCNSCHKELQDNGGIKYCPFCGAVLCSEKEKKEEMTMSNVLKKIRNRFGEDIFIKDKPRVKSYFKDIAPKLQTECRMLELALLFNIEQCFINISEDKQKEKLNEFVKEAELFLSSEVINSAISAFSDAFGYNVEISVSERIEVRDPASKVISTPLKSSRVNSKYDSLEENFEFEGNLLKKYKGKKEYVAIPSKIEIIGEKAFYGMKIKEVIFPDGLTKIKENAFEKCEKLESVIIPQTVKTIMPLAFKDCVALKEVKFTGGFDVIETSTFENCSSLEKIEFPNNCKSIANCAFKKCQSLKEITLPDTIKTIGIESFEKCTSLEMISFSGKLKSINNYAFRNCKN